MANLGTSRRTEMHPSGDVTNSRTNFLWQKRAAVNFRASNASLLKTSMIVYKWLVFTGTAAATEWNFNT